MNCSCHNICQSSDSHSFIKSFCFNRSNLNIIADVVKQEILRLYSSSNESGRFEIPLQSRVGEKPFTITLSNNRIIAELGGFKAEKNVSINANLNGTASL